MNYKPKKGRCLGENHPAVVLTDDEVDQIRRMREVERMTYTAIADKMEVSKASVADICKYRRRAVRAMR